MKGNNFNCFCQPPLVQAIFHGDTNEVRRLLKNNVDVNVQDEEKR